MAGTDSDHNLRK
uniref:Uncharacterized protein n=1 Tax=Rhizophora mucronata TaxID=61149 RepID=A0A2P2NXC9_RHIMU